MDKPPTRTKPSAETEETPDELRARLRQLAADYTAAFHQNPTEENLQTGALLRAIGESDELRRKLYGKRTSLLHKIVGAGHAWDRWVWVLGIRTAAEVHDGDPEAVARSQIRCMPWALRAKISCTKGGPGYPTNAAEREQAVAAVVAVPDYKPELKLWKKCGDLNELTVARAVLRGLGMSGEDAKSLTRKSQWEAWVRENPWCRDAP